MDGAVRRSMHGAHFALRREALERERSRCPNSVLDSDASSSADVPSVARLDRSLDSSGFRAAEPGSPSHVTPKSPLTCAEYSPGPRICIGNVNLRMVRS